MYYKIIYTKSEFWKGNDRKDQLHKKSSNFFGVGGKGVGVNLIRQENRRNVSLPFLVPSREKAVGTQGQVERRLFFHRLEAPWCWTDAKTHLSLWSWLTHRLRTTRSFSLEEGETCLEQLGFELHGLTYIYTDYFFFFPTVNTLVLWDQRLVDSMDVQPGIWRNQGWGGPTINDTWISGCARVTAPRVNCTYVHRFAFQCPCSSALWISWLCPLPIGGFLQLSGNMAITIPSIHTYNSCCRN